MLRSAIVPILFPSDRPWRIFFCFTVLTTIVAGILASVYYHIIGPSIQSEECSSFRSTWSILGLTNFIVNALIAAWCLRGEADILHRSVAAINNDEHEHSGDLPQRDAFSSSRVTVVGSSHLSILQLLFGSYRWMLFCVHVIWQVVWIIVALRVSPLAAVGMVPIPTLPGPTTASAEPRFSTTPPPVPSSMEPTGESKFLLGTQCTLILKVFASLDLLYLLLGSLIIFLTVVTELCEMPRWFMRVSAAAMQRRKQGTATPRTDEEPHMLSMNSTQASVMRVQAQTAIRSQRYRRVDLYRVTEPSARHRPPPDSSSSLSVLEEWERNNQPRVPHQSHSAPARTKTEASPKRTVRWAEDT